MKKSSMVIMGLIVVVLGAAVYRKVSSQEAFAQGVSAPMVEVINPSISSISSETSLLGTVENSDTVYVYAKAGGDVTSLNVSAGDVVKAGDPICTIDTKQVASSGSSLESAQINLQKAQQDLARMLPLYQTGDISASDYESYANAVKSAEVQYTSAKTAYDTQIEYSNITAKIDGIIEIVNIKVNDTISSGNQICVITGQGNKEVKFSVTERIRGGLSVGDEIRVEKEGNTYKGHITEISTMAEDSTGLYSVKADLDETASDSSSSDISALPTGSKVKLYVVSSHADGVLVIPKDCVYSESAGSFVYVSKDHVLSKVKIVTGIEDENNVQVLSGVNAGDQIVSTWSSELSDGTVVRIKGENVTDTASDAGNSDVITETANQ